MSDKAEALSLRQIAQAISDPGYYTNRADSRESLILWRARAVNIALGAKIFPSTGTLKGELFKSPVEEPPHGILVEECKKEIDARSAYGAGANCIRLVGHSGPCIGGEEEK